MLGKKEFLCASIFENSREYWGPPPPRLVCLLFKIRLLVGMSILPTSPFLKMFSLLPILLSSSVFQPNRFKLVAVLPLSILIVPRNKSSCALLDTFNTVYMNFLMRVPNCTGILCFRSYQGSITSAFYKAWSFWEISPDKG